MSEWQIPHEFSLPSNFEMRQLTGFEINPFQIEPPGPVGESFIYGTEPIDYLMGPMGSGKTVASIARILAVSMRFPVCTDGIIRTRIPVIRDNFRELYRTTLPSLFRFFPKDFPGSDFQGGQDRPFCFTLRFLTPRGKRLQIVIDGFGVSDDTIESALKGYECSAAALEEADLLGRRIKTFMFGRVAQGRYPGRALYRDPEAPQPRTVWGTLNAPLISHYVVEDFIEKPMGGHVLRRQPSGLSEQAENRKYVSREDYEAMAMTMSPDEVRRFVHGEFGLVGDGALVYPDYDFTIHCAKAPLVPLDLPLRIGVDAGGSPAMIVGQFTPKGHMRWLSELTTEPGTGIGRFCEYVIDHLQSKYRGLQLAFAWGDPSAFHGADRMAGELSFMETLSRALNVNVLPTPTNDPIARQESVAFFLRKRLDADGTPFFQHCPTMKVVQGGFQGGFVVALNPHDTAGRIRFVKNKFSHPHEAGQYLCYGSRGHAGVINDAARAGRPGNIVTFRPGAKARSDFNVP